MGKAELSELCRGNADGIMWIMPVDNAQGITWLRMIPVTRDCTKVLWNKKCSRVLKAAEGGVVSVLVRDVGGQTLTLCSTCRALWLIHVRIPISPFQNEILCKFPYNHRR